MCHDGEGVGRDQKEAEQWTRKEADQGHADFFFDFVLSLMKGRSRTRRGTGSQWTDRQNKNIRTSTAAARF